MVERLTSPRHADTMPGRKTRKNDALAATARILDMITFLSGWSVRTT
jgi:hypothetical protein